MQSSTNQTFSPNTKVNWWSALVGSTAAIGGSAFLGTVVANVHLWWYLAKGLSPEQAYAQMGRGLTSTVELLSLATLAIATVFGGYVSALYGNGRNLVQGLMAGVLSTSFFFIMALNPASTSVLTWSAAIYFAVATLSGLFGGYVRAQRAV